MIFKNKGMSLISLTATIVVLLIIIGIIISATINDGIINSSNKMIDKLDASQLIQSIKTSMLTIELTGGDLEGLNGFESINFSIPDKYKDKLFFINGTLFCSYSADDSFKNICEQNDVPLYYVDDESLKNLCIGTIKPISNNDTWIWEDQSNNENHYTIYNYNDSCVVSNGIQLSLSSADNIFLKDNPFETAKTAIITISNFSKNSTKYALFRGDANNFTSYISSSSEQLTLDFKTYDTVSPYYSIQASVTQQYGNVIQIATTVSDNSFQKLYVNGELVATRERNNAKACIFTKNIGGRTNPYVTENATNSEANYIVHSVQLYDRELNEQEILHNFECDKLLYSIPD